ncbi:MAG: PilZ domain-containing protein [Candidatus Omnitrophica bacterium]|nr:PilZ domain-containing protein [Candidatus Omnitrophota bacterium]
MSPWDGLNRRRFPRVNYPCQVVVRNEQDQKDVILAHTENIGVGGVCAILKKGLPMFAPVEVELDLLDFEDHVKCQGKIVWSVRRKSNEENKPMFYDIGIEFVDINDRDRERVEATVQRLVKQGRLVPET